MSQKNCNCCHRVKELQLQITRLARQIEFLKPKQAPAKSKLIEPDSELLTETLLLDLSISEQSKLLLPSLADSLVKFNSKIATLESKCLSLGALQESIHKQTAIIYYLEQKVEELSNNASSSSFSNLLKENRKEITKKQRINTLKTSPVKKKQGKSLLKEFHFQEE